MDFRKVISKKKTVILDYCNKEDLVHGNFYRRTHLVNCSTSTICLVTLSTRLTTRSTCNTRLPICSTGFSTHSTCLSTRSTPLSTRSTRLSTRSVCLSTFSTRSTICHSFDD